MAAGWPWAARHMLGMRQKSPGIIQWLGLVKKSTIGNMILHVWNCLNTTLLVGCRANSDSLQFNYSLVPIVKLWKSLQHVPHIFLVLASLQTSFRPSNKAISSSKHCLAKAWENMRKYSFSQSKRLHGYFWKWTRMQRATVSSFGKCWSLGHLLVPAITDNIPQSPIFQGQKKLSSQELQRRRWRQPSCVVSPFHRRGIFQGDGHNPWPTHCDSGLPLGILNDWKSQICCYIISVFHLPNCNNFSQVPAE